MADEHQKTERAQSVTSATSLLLVEPKASRFLKGEPQLTAIPFQFEWRQPQYRIIT